MCVVMDVMIRGMMVRGMRMRMGARSADHVRPVGGKVVQVDLCWDDSEQTATPSLGQRWCPRFHRRARGAGDAPVEPRVDAPREGGVERIGEGAGDVFCGRPWSQLGDGKGT